MTGKNDVASSIKHSIAKAGFPGKAVRLPFRPVFASCKEHGTSLGEVLEQLQEDNVFGQVKGDHIEFRATHEEARSPSPGKNAAQPPKDPRAGGGHERGGEKKPPQDVFRKF
jgi:hypothetical protein